MTKKISNIRLAKTLVALFYKTGVRKVCISPGSRNTPLTYAFIEHSKIECFSHLDERSGCFFGLGISKNIKRPVVVLTTSGTATANLFPGIIEAELSMTPLIILTADRPKRLINTGETQTINQKNMYGKHVRSTMDIDSKNMSIDKIVKGMINKLSSIDINPGPIHFNIRIDEPLFDQLDKSLLLPKNTKTYPFKFDKTQFKKFKRPLIVCGPINIDSSVGQILQLSKKMNAPILADILSNMRQFSSTMVYYENYIHNIKKPDLILRFGSKPTSKKLNNFLDKHRNITHLINIYGNHNDNCKNIHKIDLDNLDKNINVYSKGDKKWFEYIQYQEIISKQIINENINNKNSQAKIIRTVLENLEKKDSVFIGNSTTIRTIDQFSGTLKTPLNILGNYISRGIEGVTSTAMGMAYTNKKNSVLFIGDLSFFYDINAFHILENKKINLSIFVINNNGGQIFSRLPYSNKDIKDFKQFWITPLSKKIKDVAQLFNLKYFIFKADILNQKIKRIIRSKGVKIIEIKINETTDSSFIKNIENKISKALF